MKPISAALGAVLVLVCLGSPVTAIELKEWVPGLRVSPFISQRVEYQSNVFQTPDNEQDDVIFKTIPGVLVDYNFGPHSVSAGYRAEILRYLDLEDQNTVHHFGVGQLRFEFVRLILNLRDDFARTSDPPGTELTGRIDSTTNTLSPEVEYLITTRLGARLAYSWTHVDFERSVDVLDRDEHLIGGSVFWKFLPRADVGLTYSYGEKHFDSATNRDVTRHVVTVGVRGDLTAKLSSSLRAGYEQRTPEESGLSDFTGFVVGGDVTYKPTERTTLTLALDRSAQESTFANSLYYESTSATLSLTQQLGAKVTANARVGGGWNDYPTKETVGGKTDFRQDVFYGAGAGVEYSIQPWLRVGLDYALTGRDSNFPDFDFIDHRVAARITFQF